MLLDKTDNNIINIHIFRKKDLPISCPNKNTEFLHSHPKVFLAFDEEGFASCPYCSEKYKIQD